MYSFEIEHLRIKCICDHLIPESKTKPKLHDNTSAEYPSKHELSKHYTLHSLSIIPILGIKYDGACYNIKKSHQPDDHHTDTVDVYYHGV